jgi:hypothetical protein
MPHDEFHLRHAGEIREALIAIEGDSGGFELLSHGFLPEHDGTEPVLYAVVRCCDSNRVHVLAQLPKPADHPDAPLWRELPDQELNRFA